MIVLDTNVISALMRPDTNPVPISWVDRQPADRLYTTTISLMEIRLGLQLMPAGRRREAVSAGFDALLSLMFAGRILPLDAEAA